MRKIIAIALSVVSIYWIYKSFSYGIWVNKGIGGGLFPLIGGIMTLVFSVWDFIKNRDQGNPKLDPGFYKISVATLVTIAAMYLVGVIIACLIFMIAWTRFVEKYKWTRSLVISFGVMVTIYGIFKIWLAVPFYKGLLGWL